MVRDNTKDAAAKRPGEDRLGGDIKGTRSGHVHVSIGVFFSFPLIASRAIDSGTWSLWIFRRLLLELISLSLQRGYALERI